MQDESSTKPGPDSGGKNEKSGEPAPDEKDTDSESDANSKRAQPDESPDESAVPEEETQSEDTHWKPNGYVTQAHAEEKHEQDAAVERILWHADGFRERMARHHDVGSVGVRGQKTQEAVGHDAKHHGNGVLGSVVVVGCELSGQILWNRKCTENHNTFRIRVLYLYQYFATMP